MNEGQQTRLQLDDFLHPKSMLTPGLAGALTMMITNTLCSQFGFWPNYTGLLISFLFGLVVFRSQKRIHLFEQCICYVLNSLIIFSIAVGTNQAGVSVTHRADSAERTAVARKGTRQAPFFVNWLDGTVPLREELIKHVKKLDNNQAKEILNKLQINKPEYLQSPKNALEGVLSTAKTGEDIHEFVLAYGDESHM